VYNLITKYVNTHIPKLKDEIGFIITADQKLIVLKEIPKELPTLAQYVEDDNYELYYDKEAIYQEKRFNLLVFLFTDYRFYGDVVIIKKGNKI
jgi:hypothetical protein